MFRPMRRAAQALDRETSIEVLQRCGEGVLAVSGDDGYPYAVPVNYVCAGGRIIIHGAPEGHKADAIRRSDKVSFAVIDEKTVVPEEYSTAYRSVIVFGRAHFVTDREEMTALLRPLAARFVPSASEEARMKYIQAGLSAVAVIVIDIEHITGKEGNILRRRRLAAQAGVQ